MNENWWGWIAVILFFVIAQAWRALFRIAKAPPNNGLARLNAAAERILKERGVTQANPLPRTKPSQAKPAQKPARVHHTKTHVAMPLPKSTTPAVVRRGGLLSGKEPVIQRRH